ncbi:MAG TPA: hypothetical protein VF585_03595 [Chthoniobacterales bacterium]
MSGWLNSLKDTALSATVRQVLASKIEAYGKIEQFKIDTKTRIIDVAIRLEGETSPVQVTLKNYEIAEKNGVTQVSAPSGAFTASRPWLGKVLNAELAGRVFVIPEKYAKYAKGLIG